MQIHLLRPRTKNRRGQRVGRGGKRGKTAGRGTKGQKSRAGAKIRPAIRDIIKKIPKRRGRGKHSFRPFRVKPVAVSLATIVERFPAGAKINPAALLATRVIHKMKGRVPEVKVVGSGPLEKTFHFEGIACSDSARTAITTAKGTIRPVVPSASREGMKRSMLMSESLALRTK